MNASSTLHLPSVSGLQSLWAHPSHTDGEVIIVGVCPMVATERMRIYTVSANTPPIKWKIAPQITTQTITSIFNKQINTLYIVELRRKDDAI